MQADLAVSAAGRAGHACVDRGGPATIRSTLNRSPTRAPRPPIRARSASSRSRRTIARYGLVVPRLDEDPVSPSCTISGMPPAPVATMAREHAMASRIDAEPFGDRAHRKEIESLHAAEHVGPEARQQDVLSR